MESKNEIISDDELKSLSSATQNFYPAERSLAALAADEDRIKSRKISALANYGLRKDELDEIESALFKKYGTFKTIKLDTGEIVR